MENSELKTRPDNEFDSEKITEQDAIETKEMKERAFRIANLRKQREDLIDKYQYTMSPGLKLSLIEIVGHLRELEREIEGSY